LVGFTAYSWLLKVSTPARVSTYAYVNPVIALFLGWALADERLTPRSLAAAAVIIAGVVIISTRPARLDARAQSAN
jgi:drug/metabolite transporter (DMT)-like permease